MRHIVSRDYSPYYVIWVRMRNSPRMNLTAALISSRARITSVVAALLISGTLGVSPARPQTSDTPPPVTVGPVLTPEEFYREIVDSDLCGTPNIGPFAGRVVCTRYDSQGTAVLHTEGNVLARGLWRIDEGKVCRRGESDPPERERCVTYERIGANRFRNSDGAELVICRDRVCPTQNTNAATDVAPDARATKQAEPACTAVHVYAGMVDHVMAALAQGKYLMDSGCGVLSAPNDLALCSRGLHVAEAQVRQVQKFMSNFPVPDCLRSIHTNLRDALEVLDRGYTKAGNGMSARDMAVYKSGLQEIRVGNQGLMEGSARLKATLAAGICLAQ
jgi:hypothetical protein